MTKFIGYLDDDVLELGKNLEFYFDHRGGLIPDVFTEYNSEQGGDGLFDVFRGIARFFRPAMPLISSGVRALGKQALSTIGGLAGDVLAGADIRAAGKERMGEAQDALTKKFESKLSRMSGAGQYGSGGRRNKTLHNAVKLFSFSPSSVAGGRQTTCRKRKQTRKTLTKKKRKAKKRITLPQSARKRRRRRVVRKSPTIPKKNRTVRKRRRRRPIQRFQIGGGDFDSGFVF